jgi:carboxylesterase
MSESPAPEGRPAESAVLPGAEAWSAEGGPHGALVVHGFTGNPSSLRPLAEAFAAAGFAVELPRLPGHGTVVDDMLPTTWADWSGEVEAAYERLAGRCDRVVVAGLSMGATLSCWLAARRPEVAGLVLVNPAVEPAAESFLEALQAMLDAGETVMPGIGSDIAKEGVVESAYEGTPIAPLRTLMEAVNELDAVLPDITCPTLLFTSAQDHVVAPSSSDHVAARLSGPVERVTLERSYHVATLDHDAELIETRAVEFARKVTTA